MWLNDFASEYIMRLQSSCWSRCHLKTQLEGNLLTHKFMCCLAVFSSLWVGRLNIQFFTDSWPESSFSSLPGELFWGQIRTWQLTSWRRAREQNKENMPDWSHVPLITLFQKRHPIAPASYYALEMNQWVHSKFKRKRLYKSMNTN